MECSAAILIGRHRLTETSLIVHWWTTGHGLVKTVAKGALRPKSPFAGRLDLFVSADIRWTISRTGDLHTLTEAQLTEMRMGLRNDYSRVLTATYLIKLLEWTVERESHVEGLSDLLTKALDYLCLHPASRTVVERFELRLAELFGVAGGLGKPISALQALVHKPIPPQRRQLWSMLKG
ncbi:MAG: DNA repair protein RecO [Verrucomicrobiaceae bacterium]|nr:DNA repair protein RecO [Verrucomicrobiaceae bacterium]